VAILKNHYGDFLETEYKGIRIMAVRLVDIILYALYDIITIHPLGIKKLVKILGNQNPNKHATTVIVMFDNVGIAEARYNVFPI